MFMRSVVVHDDVHVQRSGHVLIDLPQKVQIFLMPVALREDRSFGRIQRRKQGRSSVAQVIVSDSFDVAQPYGNIGWLRSRGWIWLFSSTHNTTALSGGFRYRPTMSRTFSTKNGSVDSLKSPCRGGSSPT